MKGKEEHISYESEYYIYLPSARAKSAFFILFVLENLSMSLDVNHPSPKDNGLLRCLRTYLRSLITYALLILIGVSTSPLVYRAVRLTTLLFAVSGMTTLFAEG